jgi:hypothetical protein
VPPGREGEAGPRGSALAIAFDGFAGRSPAEQTAVEEVLLPAQTRSGDLGTVPDEPLVLEQGFEHTDRRVERRPRRAVRRVAVPSAVGELLGQKAVDEASNVLLEVGADCPDLAVDAGLGLAGEERVVGHLLRAASCPRDAFGDHADGASCPVSGRVEAHVPQEPEDVHR